VCRGTGGAISPTIFNLNGQVLGDGAHNTGGARLPVCCDAADRGQFRTAAAACRAAAPATAVRALAKLPPGERSAVRSKQWCGDVMSRLSLRLAGISTSAVSCFGLRRLHRYFFPRGQSPLKCKGEQHVTKDGIVGLFTIASFVAREGHRPPGSNGLVVDLRQDRDQTNPGCRQW
jgi:hypothetical protein